MRLIDADALLVSIDDHSYQVYHGVGFGDADCGMTVDGIKQCIDEAPTIVMGKNAETCIPEDEADSGKREDDSLTEFRKSYIAGMEQALDVADSFVANLSRSEDESGLARLEREIKEATIKEFKNFLRLKIDELNEELLDAQKMAEEFANHSDSSQDAAKPEPARPHICDVLGVDVDEEFSFNSETRRYKRAKVNERGRLIAWDDSGDCWNCVGNHGVCWLINHPDALRKRPKAELTADEDAKAEPAKPRICDLLGVDVGDPFTVDGYCGRLSLNADGTFRVLSGDGKNSTYSVMQAIENPTRVHRSVLTEPEIAICKALGAKWVTNTGEAEDVYLWSEKPTWDNDLETYIGGKWLGEVDRCLFSSIYPGDCIEVPE